MKSNVNARFYVEAGFALLSGCLAVLTLFWRDWIEVLTGFNPDYHLGWLEGVIFTGLFLAGILASFAARTEWHRQRPVVAAGS